MAHFYGSIQGQAGTATRQGSRRSGYQAWAQSNTAQVSVSLAYDEREETNMALIALRDSTRDYRGRTAFSVVVAMDAIFGHLDDPEVHASLHKAEVALARASSRALTLEKIAKEAALREKQHEIMRTWDECEALVREIHRVKKDLS